MNTDTMHGMTTALVNGERRAQSESAEIKAARLDLAKRHLRSVRSLHVLGIGQTEIGFVELTYVDGVYKLTKGVVDRSELVVLAQGAPRVVAPVLANLYVVEA